MISRRLTTVNAQKAPKNSCFLTNPASTALVYRAAKLIVCDAIGENVGEIWLTHGNAGDTLRDKFAVVSHGVLRRPWRPLQSVLLPKVWTTAPSTGSYERD